MHCLKSPHSNYIDLKLNFKLISDPPLHQDEVTDSSYTIYEITLDLFCWPYCYPQPEFLDSRCFLSSFSSSTKACGNRYDLNLLRIDSGESSRPRVFKAISNRCRASSCTRLVHLNLLPLTALNKASEKAPFVLQSLPSLIPILPQTQVCQVAIPRIRNAWVLAGNHSLSAERSQTACSMCS